MPMGKKSPVTEIGKTQWMVETENDLPVTLCYKVLLNHDEREWQWGKPETPYVQEDCIFLARICSGSSSQKWMISSFNVDVPENWRVSTSWQRIGNEGHRFAITGENNLMSAYLLLGTHSERIARLSKGAKEVEIVLALGGRFKTSMDEVQKTVDVASGDIFGSFRWHAGRSYVVCGQTPMKDTTEAVFLEAVSVF